jgi:integrase/recombinase XerD
LSRLEIGASEDPGRTLQTKEIYTRADPSIKLEALYAVTAPALRSGRFRASDKLIASLTSRSFMR